MQIQRQKNRDEEKQVDIYYIYKAGRDIQIEIQKNREKEKQVDRYRRQRETCRYRDTEEQRQR